MERDNFLKIVSLYKKENNITRLVYRLIKYEYEENLENKSKWLSRSDIWRISQKIIFTPNDIEKEKNRIQKEKEKILKEKAKFLEEEGYREIEFVENNCLKYKDKESDYTYYNNFPLEFNSIDKIYFLNTKNQVEEAINYLLNIKYIKGYKVKNINPYKKNINLGSTIRFKSIK